MMTIFLLFLSVATALEVGQLTVEYEPNLRGSVVPNPRFSWIINPNGLPRGTSQSAYQIQVSTSSNVTGDVWDSGKIVSQDNTLHAYGAVLKSDTAYYWHVRVWDNNNQASSYSSNNIFTTGLLTKSEWHGSWVQGAMSTHNQVRYEFSVDPTDSVTRASAFISGIGYYELYINGHRIGDHKLDVGWTNYDYTVLYSTYDVTSDIQLGANAVGIMLGRGWFSMEGYGNPQAVLQLNIYLKSGKVVEVVTDPSTWKSFPGPITYDDIYNGERYNATMETPGWTQSGFDGSAWSNAGLGAWGIASTMKANFSPQVMPAIKEITTLNPISMWEPSRGTYVFDFDQNFSGWIRLRLEPLPANVSITLRHAELLYHDGSGNIYTGNLRSAQATDVYVTKGDMNGEMYEPRFTYHGFRFLEITGLPYVPFLTTATGVHIRSSVEQTGSVSFSNPLLNKIQSNILWGQTSNLMSVPTDCDQRDERKGWTGDSALTAEEASLNFAMGSFFTNWLARIRDVLNRWDTGYICDIVPSEGSPNPPDPAWSSVYPTVAWSLLHFQGDHEIIVDHWDSLNRYMSYWYSSVQTTGLGNMYYQFGDWVPPPPAPMVSGHFTAAFAYLHDIKLMIEMATATGETADANMYTSLFANMTEEFNSAFYDSTKKTYADGGQTAQSLALWLGVVPQADQATVVANLANDIMVTNKEHLTCGIIGTKFLFEALSAYGRTDVGLALASQTTYPSWGYMIKPATNETPATTIWELWDSDNEGDGMNSRNHIMFGTVSAWFHRSLAGVWPGKDNLGYTHILFKPEVYQEITLDYVDDTLNTLRGQVRSSWIRPVAIPCGKVGENSALTLTCSDSSAVISAIVFASYGTPTGSCPNLAISSTCNSPNSVDVVTKTCLGLNSCTLQASNDFFGGDPCLDTVKLLAVVVNCSNPNGNHVLAYSVTVPVTSVADVSLPGTLGSGAVNTVAVQESGKIVWSNGNFVNGSSGVTSGKVDGNRVVFSVLSGTYNFDLFQ